MRRIVRSRAIGAVVAVAVVATVAVVFAQRSRARFTPAEGTIRSSGTVEATEIGVASKTTGLITRLTVSEGDAVQEGDIIAELDRATLEAELARAEAAAYTATMQLADVARGARDEEVRARSARLAEAIAALQGARAAAQTAREAYERPTELLAAVDAAGSEIEAARAKTALSRAQQAEAIAGPLAQEIAAARAEFERAEAALRGAEAVLVQAERAYSERIAATTQVTGAETQLAIAQAELSAADARRETVEAPPREARREQLAHRVAGARAALGLAEANLNRAQKLREADAATEAELDAARSQHEQAAAVLLEAEAALADLDAGARDMEQREAEAGVSKAAAGALGAERGLVNARHEQAILQAAALQQLEQARSAAEQARHARDQAAARLDLLLAGTRPERLEQAAAAVSASEAILRGAESALAHASQAEVDRFGPRVQLETATQQVAISEARVQVARAELDLALAGSTTEAIEMARGKLMEAEAVVKSVRTRIADTEIRAPRSGTISEIILREGETVSPGSVVVRMLDLEHLWVRVYLPLPAFGRIVRGQSAEVYSDAYPGLAYPGTVFAVSDESEFTPKNVQTADERVKQVFWVKVDVGDGRGELKSGMPVDVVIVAGATVPN